MKKRLCFVSNSSSASFIIYADKDTDIKDLYIPLMEVIKEDQVFEYTDIETYNKQIRLENITKDDKIIEAINNGKKVIVATPRFDYFDSKDLHNVKTNTPQEFNMYWI